MNTYIIDTGAICTTEQSQNIYTVFTKVLLFSTYLKPGLYNTHQPIISIQKDDLIVCNIGDVEVRIYPKPATIEILTLNLSPTDVLQNYVPHTV